MITRTLIGRISGMLLGSPKNRFFGSKKLQTKKKVDDGSEFERAFCGAVQFALDSGFSNILSRVETCPGRSLAPLHQAKRCVCSASSWMREFSDLSNRSEGMCIFAQLRVQLS